LEISGIKKQMAKTGHFVPILNEKMVVSKKVFSLKRPLLHTQVKKE